MADTTADTPAPRRRGPYAKSAARREQILEAAFEVFAARGYHRGSFQDVADRLGVSQSSLFHHFPTKHDLLLAVLELRDRAGERLAPGDAFAASLLRQAERNREIPGVIALYAILSGEAVSEGHPARAFLVERLARVRGDYAAELRAIGAAGGLREGVEPDLAAATIAALWDGAQTQDLLDPGAVDVPRMLRAYLDLVLVRGA
jgi:AcrR family transcriptional regulator